MASLTQSKDYLFNKKETMITSSNGGRERVLDDKNVDLDKMTYSEMLDYMEKNPVMVPYYILIWYNVREHDTDNKEATKRLFKT